jgi:hypothetical protein
VSFIRTFEIRLTIVRDRLLVASVNRGRRLANGFARLLDTVGKNLASPCGARCWACDRLHSLDQRRVSFARVRGSFRALSIRAVLQRGCRLARGSRLRQQPQRGVRLGMSQ